MSEYFLHEAPHTVTCRALSDTLPHLNEPTMMMFNFS